MVNIIPYRYFCGQLAKFCFFVLFAFFSVCSLAQAQDTVAAKAIRIMDGDTFEALIEGNVTERIRLHGIDCPERNQPYSDAAKDKLVDLIFSKQIKFIRMAVDRYGRTVAMVFVDNTNVNESLLRAGLAWHFKRYDHNPAWDALERTASAKRLGLWADAQRMPPWNWRKQGVHR
jgi:micrococcal nuclease